MKTITVPLPSLIVAFVAGTLLYIVGCKEPVDPYPNYSAPTGDEALLIQQSKIRQQTSTYETGGDEPNVLAETLILEYSKQAKKYPVTYEYDAQGIVREPHVTYRRAGNQIIVSPEDTLFLNQQGFVNRTNKKRSWQEPGGYQYKYDAAGYLIEELLPSFYMSGRESSFQINCRHEYENGNRVQTILYLKSSYDKKPVDSLVISFEYNTRLINSGLSYQELNAICTVVGCTMSDRLQKYHPSLYGKLNRNLPIRAVVRHIIEGRWSDLRIVNYKFEYTFNAKKQVTSMLLTERWKTFVEGLYETYEYVD